MPLPAVLRRPEARRTFSEDTTVRYNLDARIVRALRAARQARLARGDFASRQLLLQVAATLREFVGGGADALVLAELDMLGLTLDRVPRCLLGQLFVGLAKHIGEPEARLRFTRAAGQLLASRAA